MKACQTNFHLASPPWGSHKLLPKIWKFVVELLAQAAPTQPFPEISRTPQWALVTPNPSLSAFYITSVIFTISRRIRAGPFGDLDPNPSFLRHNRIPPVSLGPFHTASCYHVTNNIPHTCITNYQPILRGPASMESVSRWTGLDSRFCKENRKFGWKVTWAHHVLVPKMSPEL